MEPAAWDLFAELKGYVDASIDAYQDDGGIPFAAMEEIQKRIKAIHALEYRGGRS